MSTKHTDSEMLAVKIKEYIEERKKSKELHLLKDKPTNGKGGIIHKLIARYESLADCDKAKLEAIKKQRKPKDTSDIAFQREKYVQLVNLFTHPPQNIIDEYLNAVERILKEHDFSFWLEEASNKVGSRKYVTHIAKLTHSSITSDASSFFDEEKVTYPMYLTTSSLSQRAIDITGNAGVSHYSSLLDLEFNGKQLKDYVLANDASPFYMISSNKDVANKWLLGFKKVFSPQKPCTHSLAKQIYFPVEGKYCLLVNLTSSSMAHHIFKVKQKIREQIATNKYTKFIVMSFPNSALIKITASRDAHRNVSKLHVDRNGSLELFSAQPPVWQSQLKPPVYRYSLFDDLSNETIRTEMDYLRDFLLRFKQLDLSIKNPKRFRHLERWVNTIIDEFLFYVGMIQNLPAGWSNQADIRLKKAHQYLLDPYRQGASFQAARQNMDWQKVIRDDFAAWMNKQLRGKDKQFTPKAEHSRLWKKLLEQPLREQEEYIESELKYKKGGRV